MIPLKDRIPHKSFPIMTLLLIAGNCAIFIQELLLSAPQRDLLVQSYALVPWKSTAIFLGHDVSVAQAFLPFITSMFLHGGWMHLIGNMWFLWIFGGNVEDRLGHLRYLAFYLGAGLVGALTHVAFNTASLVPTLGASGAVAGVMGAYLVLFPGARILTLVPIFIFLTTVELPAYVILLYWILIQFLSGTVSLAMSDASAGGVAWFAHIGGFLGGMVLLFILRKGRR